MWLTARALVILLTLVAASGGAGLTVHALLATPWSISGSDFGLDADGDGRFDWLVIEAQVPIPEGGMWEIYADLSASSAATGLCGFGGPVPAREATSDGYGSIAWAYERYFFPAGPQAVRFAFAGADIFRAGVDGPYAVHVRMALGGIVLYAESGPPGEPSRFLEWTYTTSAYGAGDFDEPIRPAYFSGGHSDSAVDLDADGFADLLEIRAEVSVRHAGRYFLSGSLWAALPETGEVRYLAGSYAEVDLVVGEGSLAFRFPGVDIRYAGVDAPWDFQLVLSTVYAEPYGNVSPWPSDGILPPEPWPVPETLCGRTSPYAASDFEESADIVRFTGRFEEFAPDWDGSGAIDALVVRAEVESYATAGFDLSGVLRSEDGALAVARTYGQVWLGQGLSWVEFPFQGPDIRASGVDGPYLASLSIEPVRWGADPTAEYTTQAYRAMDFDAGDATRPGTHWISNASAASLDSRLRISVTVQRGDDMLTVVVEDTLHVIVSDGSGAVAAQFRDRVYLPSAGTSQSFEFFAEGLAPGRYVVSIVLGPPDAPVDREMLSVVV